jgi:hypothetical protein
LTPTTITLRAANGDQTTIVGATRHLPFGQRAVRSGVIVLVAVVAAAMLIPIPIIHLLGIPMVLLAGVVMAVRQLRSVTKMERVTIACPRCGEPNRFGGGMGYRSHCGPESTQCESCRRPLELSWRESEEGERER